MVSIAPRKPTSLINRPRILDGEALNSYQIRLTRANYYDPPGLLSTLIRKPMGDVGLRTRTDLLANADVFRLFSQLSHVDIETLYQATLHRFAPMLMCQDDIKSIELTNGIRKSLLSPHIAAKTTFKQADLPYCPLCLGENALFKLIWSINRVVVCLDHNCLLVRGCPTCGKGLTIDEIVNVQSKCCHVNLVEVESFFLRDEFSLTSQKIIQDRLMCVTSTLNNTLRLPNVSPYVFFRTLDGLKSILAQLGIRWEYFDIPTGIELQSIGDFKVRYEKTFRRALVLCITAFNILIDWPHNFYQFLDRYQFRKGRKLSYVMSKDFGLLLGTWLDKNWQSESFGVIQQAFNQYLVDERYPPTESLLTSNRYLQDKKLQASLPYVNLAGAAKLLGTGTRYINTLSMLGYLSLYGKQPFLTRPGTSFYLRDSVVKFREERKSSIYLTDVMIRIGAERDFVLELANAGFLRVLRSPNIDGARKWQFSQAETEKFLNNVQQVALMSDASDLVSLTTATHVLGSRIERVELISMIINKELKCYVKSDVNFSLKSIFFDKIDIIQLKAKLKARDIWLSASDAAKFLGVKPNTLNRWMIDGLIDARFTEKGESIRFYFSVQALSSFQERYVASKQAAQILNVSVLVIQKWVRMGRLHNVNKTTTKEDSSVSRYLFDKQYLQEWKYSRLTFGEAVAMLKIPRSTFNDWIKKGYIQPLDDMAGKQRWFAREDILNLMCI